MKNILTITSSFPRYNGDYAGNFIFKLSASIAKKGYHMIILAPYDMNSKLIESIGSLRVYRFKYFYPNNLQKLSYGGGIANNLKNSNLAKIELPLFFILELYNTIIIIKKENIQIIHSHWLLPQGFNGAICKKIFQTYHIATIHGSDINTIKKSMILRKVCSFICNNSDLITTNSSYTRDKLLSICKIEKSKVKIIPMGIFIPENMISNDICNLKKELNTNKLILNVGRLINWKGTKYLIIAMSNIIKQYPDAKLVIVGKGPEKESLIKLSNELNLHSNIIFLDKVDNAELEKYYLSADVFVLPSIDIDGQTEGLGVVLLEAMSYGVPVVGTNVGGIPDIIKDNYNGYLVQQKSPEELSTRIIQILSDNGLSKKFIINGLNTMHDYFTWEIIANNFSLEYEKLLQEVE
ncbi:putative glycosyltransferase [Methanocella paludicola SANAE]|uniref:Glycosyltransferase n=1 Tax=Methanocella paludicola (strain DSM 17711 / JCM 13418 / NBRC 101707 / SANAE) TaxID=304371 RepID=D1YWZ3_METPS|nr:glycosyltransferase family 4 protein [Methanocella paludicola]BAI60965.1 putative glycosyltransferase [Methanocella paludicola SANAE]